jgi:transcriptional regulator with XRE-family HTH domain
VQTPGKPADSESDSLSDTTAPSDAQVFGHRIQRERARLALTQTQLADALGISRITLAKYENGRSAPDLPTLARGARSVGLDLEYLVTGVRAKLGPDVGWALIRQTLALIRRHLLLHGKEITPQEEAEIVRDTYLIVAGTTGGQHSSPFDNHLPRDL